MRLNIFRRRPLFVSFYYVVASTKAIGFGNLVLGNTRLRTPADLRAVEVEVDKYVRAHLGYDLDGRPAVLTWRRI